MKPKSLILSKYQPNFADPRVKSRVETVLAFCKPMLVHPKAKSIPSALLTQVFGNQKSPLSARLRYKLLQQEGTYTPGKQSFSYTLKLEGYAELAAAIGQAMPAVGDVARSLYGDLASGAVAPVYTEPTPGARRIHPVQNLPRDLRANLFKGWFDYDIEAAAPTLVFQLACKVQRALYPTKVGVPYPSIARLVEDRVSVRQHVGGLAGIDISTKDGIKAAKGIVTALFFAAPLVPNKERSIYKLMQLDWSAMERLKADPFVKGFQREVRSMWQTALMDENARNGRAALNGEPVVPKAATKAKQRMGIYLRLERQVINVVESVLRDIGSVPVLMHDGFMVSKMVDCRRIEQEIQARTGYVIRLAEAHVGMQDEDLKDGLSDGIVDLET